MLCVELIERGMWWGRAGRGKLPVVGFWGGVEDSVRKYTIV
jgi:hypothetical protein